MSGPRRHRAKAHGWTPGSGLAQAVLGPLEPTRSGVLAWLRARVATGRPFHLSPELGAFLLRELERHDRGEA